MSKWLTGALKVPADKLNDPAFDIFAHLGFSKKDVEAEILAINAGLKSRRQAISERGYDAEQVDAEIAADKARTDALGLSFGAPPVQKEDIPDE